MFVQSVEAIEERSISARALDHDNDDNEQGDLDIVKSKFSSWRLGEKMKAAYRESVNRIVKAEEQIEGGYSRLKMEDIISRTKQMYHEFCEL